MKKILFITPYPYDEAPSQRFRFEQYFRFLGEHGLTYHQEPFLNRKTWNVLYKPGYSVRKLMGIIAGFWRRWQLMLRIGKYDFIFIHREAAPLGPPVFEFIISKLWRKPFNYDFDDAIWLPNTSSVNKIVSRLKWHQKVRSLCRWADSVTCGNDFLKAYAEQFNDHALCLPTTIDTRHIHNRTREYNPGKMPTIGWTGTHSTINYLEDLIPVLKALEVERVSFEFVVISNRRPEIDLKDFRYIEWNKENEINDLLGFDVGVMPLENNTWTKGKCGFKILQYMALGIIPVASPVGVNKNIIEHGKNGYLCESDGEWLNTLKRLLKDGNRPQISREARNTVEKHYSVDAHKENFICIFNKIL